ncbi:5'/3'-nucleotidase SurE [Roseofilum sp. Belize Diploria]|uniref:5'/3'-nucleotidase SurE n=1 Tax=Roseofilum sp. Belize Diploria TaxID=2821501 RepID=UPI001B1DED72|nr:5'/3'-nucleotidase SurE [Roseofilum sp. Belize Diploria]MBP0007505.1 5'/3'-nucleotidase SurE [Roseofilum sp. Belize Diploria]
MIILTNDDGIDAPGIRALHDAVEGEGIIVAPTVQYSGCSHQTTTYKPLKMEERSPTEYAVQGAPADCTRLAIAQLQPQLNQEIDWVLSGVNAGGNMGVDVYMSGTVAAVREAAFHGIPGIAISHWIKRPLEIDWEQTTQWTAHILSKLFSHPLEPGCFWNVNIPHLETGSPEPEMVFCPLSKKPLPLQYRINEDEYLYCGNYDRRDRTPGTDVDVCFSGKISVTQVRI